jgi:hypothetical protein
MKYLTLPFPSSTLLALSEGVLSTDLYSKPTDINQYLLPSSCHPPHVVISFAKTFLDNTLFVTPSFQIIFKLNQSLFQRFVGGANSPDSKSLTV